MEDRFFYLGEVGVPRAIGPGTSWVVSDTQPIGEGYDEFTLAYEGEDPEVLGAGATFGPVLGAIGIDGREVAVKLFLPLQPEYTRAFLYDYATHEWRRASQDLGPRFVRAYALLESQDALGDC